MNLKTIGIGLSILCFLFSPSSASDDSHLLPEDSLYSEFYSHFDSDDLLQRYEENVLRVFGEIFDRDVFGRAIVHPSFQNEYAVALKLHEGKFSLSVLQPKIHIWRFSLVEIYEAGKVSILGDDDGSQLQEDLRDLKQGLPASPIDIPVDICEQKIPADLGEKLYFLWGDMLFRTRYPDRRPLRLDGDNMITIGTDGVTYHFSFEYNAERLAGQIWSPAPESITGKFVAITERLARSCDDTDEKMLIEIEKMVSDLTNELSNSAY